MNKKIFFIKKNKIIIINLLLILTLSFSIFDFISSKEELQNMKFQIVNLNNNNSRNSAKAQELENLIKLSYDNGYVKEYNQDINNYFLSDLNNAGIVITKEDLVGRNMDYRFIEGHGDSCSVNRLFNIISKKYNLAFEIIELKVWPEAEVFQFFIKYNMKKNNWIGKAQELSFINFDLSSQNGYSRGFSGERYYYENNPELSENKKPDDFIINEPPDYVRFKGYIISHDNSFFLFEIYNKAFIFKLNEKKMIRDIKYQLYYDNGLFLIEDLKIYRIEEQ